MRALAIAATGMNAQQLNVEVIANNIANINTTAFKRARAEFTDLLYQAERPAGVPNRGNQEPIPEGAQVGLGVRTAAIRNLHLQGALTSTGNKLDLAINGRGWFQIEGTNGETFYTRAGAFNKNANGQVVTLDGNLLQPAITVPRTPPRSSSTRRGEVFARIDGQVDPQSLGQITLANFANDAGLDADGRQSLSADDGIGRPGDRRARRSELRHRPAGLPRALQRRSGASEITELITAQRSYEMNSKVVQAVDEMYSTVSRG